MKIVRISIVTGISHSREINVTQEQLDAWKKGTLIQNAMPQLSKGEREFIMTGTTEKEWEELYSED